MYIDYYFACYWQERYLACPRCFSQQPSVLQYTKMGVDEGITIQKIFIKRSKSHHHGFYLSINKR